MKRTQTYGIFILVLLLSCSKKEDTSVIVSARNFVSNDPVDGLTVYIQSSKTGPEGKYKLEASKKLENGSAVLTFKADNKKYNYATFGETIDNTDQAIVVWDHSEIITGNTNYLSFQFSKWGSVNIGLHNIQYNDYDDKMKFKIEPISFNVYYGLDDFWDYNNIYGDQNEPNYHFTYLPAGPYLVTWDVQRSNGNSYTQTDTIQVPEDSTLDYMIEY